MGRESEERLGGHRDAGGGDRAQKWAPDAYPSRSQNSGCCHWAPKPGSLEPHCGVARPPLMHCNSCPALVSSTHENKDSGTQSEGPISLVSQRWIRNTPGEKLHNPRQANCKFEASLSYWQVPD